MEDHDKFREWVTERGVKINGITAHKFEGRGVGLIAEERLESGKTILTVPISTLRTAQTLPKDLQPFLRSAPTIHGILALMLATDTSPEYKIWSSVLPTISDFKSTMPIHYPSRLQDLLPPKCKILLKAQKQKLHLDWTFAASYYPKLNYDSYLYAWLLVNTRTFYFVSPTPGTKTPKNHEDCLAFSPYADYFNHASRGCIVSSGVEGYSVKTNRAYETGEELFISYGNHSNDVLLTEYGFISPGADEVGGNEWDEVLLDDYILPLLHFDKKETLKNRGFLGNYVLDKSDVCYRTQVALRAKFLSTSMWDRFVSDGIEGEGDQKMANEILLRILTQYDQDAEMMVRQILKLKDGEESHRDMLIRRWRQVSSLLRGMIDRTKG